MSVEFDQELINEFLTEAGELIEQLDADLVTLESEPDAPGLLDQIFRALHTIKGAASFLALTELIEFAHAAEDALNKLRKGEVAVDQNVMDALLQSVDILRGQLGEIGDGAAITPGPPELIATLEQIAAGNVGGSGANSDTGSADAPAQSAADAPAPEPQTPAGPTQGPNGATFTPMNLPPEKDDLVPFMAEDITDVVAKINGLIDQYTDNATRAEAAGTLNELGDALHATAAFFDIDSLTKLAKTIEQIGHASTEVAEDLAGAIAIRLRVVSDLLSQAAGAIAEGNSIAWPLDTFLANTDACIQGTSSETNTPAEPDAVIAAEIAINTEAVAPEQEAQAPEPAAAPAQTQEHAAQEATQPEPAPKAEAEDAPAAQAKNPPAERPTNGGGAEQTIRVEVSRLEALLNLVGEMVLTKNQVMGHAKAMRNQNLSHEFLENINTISSDLDRLTGELQMGVMRTRMQPLSKLFGRYPRIIRDLARKTGKQVNLEIVGGETEVDKSVLESLGDPLVHMLRNSVDHGLEDPDGRQKAGKDPAGNIKLSAEHQGGHVRVAITDDGKGIDRNVIANKAIEKGLTTPDACAQLSDSEVFKFIFAAGFSTAAQVSDLSGRGVGMDVVRTNIAKLGGQVNVLSTLGKGTTLEILIPLTVAIMPAMIVGVADREYAIPIMSIFEIVRATDQESESVAGKPVIRLREEVLPLIDMREQLGEPASESDTAFAVVVGVGEEKAGLVVDRLIGQQEIVIKPLDDEYTSGGPFSGATIREDGEVSLILDIVKLIRTGAGHAELAGA